MFATTKLASLPLRLRCILPPADAYACVNEKEYRGTGDAALSALHADTWTTMWRLEATAKTTSAGPAQRFGYPPCRAVRAALETMRMVTIDDVRRLARSLPRSEEHLIRGRIKFRIGRIVYLAFSRDGKTMGFAFPKEWRAGLVEAETDKFCMPEASDLRYNWVCVRLEAIDKAEMRTLVTEAWRFVVPKRVAAEHLDEDGSRRRRRPRIDPSRS